MSDGSLFSIGSIGQARGRLHASTAHALPRGYMLWLGGIASLDLSSGCGSDFQSQPNNGETSSTAIAPEPSVADEIVTRADNSRGVDNQMPSGEVSADSAPAAPSVSPPGSSPDAGPVSSGDSSAASPEPSTSSSPQVATGASDTTIEDGSSPVAPAPSDVVATPLAQAFTVAVQLASDLDAAAPTTVGVVTWALDVAEVSDAHIEFGLTTDYGMRAPVDLAEADYRTLLLGMKPSQTYHFRIIASDGTTSYASDDHTIETGPVTTAVDIGSFEVLDAEKREPGFVVASYWAGTTSAVAFILDADGEIVWAYDTGIAGGIARARMSEDGQHVWIITASNSGGALQRVSIDGLEGETYSQTVGSHDITSVSGSTMAYIDYGESDCDSIFEIEVSGETREIWDSEARFGSASSGSGRPGVGASCHGNALRYSASEDVYTFSDVSTDVWVIGRDGEFQWGLAERVNDGVAAWGGRNHGHHLLDDQFVIFANSGGAGGTSAVVEYTLQGEEIWRYESGDSSANLGDVQRLPGGNTLVTFSNDSIVHEVTQEKELVLRWTGATNSRIGYILWRPSLYGPSPDIHD